MKKALILTIVIAILTVSFSGCANTEPKEKYTLKLSGFSDSIPQLSSTQEYDAWVQPDYVDQTRVGDTLSFSVGDIKLEGVYKKTEIQTYDRNCRHIYRRTPSEGKPIGSFYVTDEGRLVKFVLTDRFTKEATESGLTYTEEECREIALDYAKELFDISNYTITSQYDESIYGYDIQFKKYLNGFLTADGVSILVMANGQLLGFYSRMLEQMPTEDVNVNFDLEEIKKQIQVRLEERYAYFDGEYAIGFEIESTVLTLDEDDNYVLAVFISTDLKTKPETGKPLTVYREGLTFAVWEN